MRNFNFTADVSCGNMLRIMRQPLLVCSLCLVLLLGISCSLFSVPDDSGGGSSSGDMSELRLSFDWESVTETKAVSESIDTNRFLLELRNSAGEVIYNGAYGDSPEKFELPADSYTVRAVSSDFNVPAFSAPQYGDEQCVVVPSGKAIGVKLNCTMMNCGICLKVASGFLTQYPKSSLFVKSDDGRLPYSYTERVYVPEIQFFVVSTAMRMPLGSEACPPPGEPPEVEEEETLTESFRTSPAERFFVMSVFVSAALAIRRLIFPGRK